MPQDTPENAPLLGNGHREETPLGPGPLCLDAASWQAKSPASIVLLVTLVKFCAVTSGMLMLVPMYRLMEDALCHVHFRDDSHDLMDEARCKVDAVQSRLAFLIGWIGLVNSITSECVHPFPSLAVVGLGAEVPGLQLWLLPFRTARLPTGSGDAQPLRCRSPGSPGLSAAALSSSASCRMSCAASLSCCCSAASFSSSEAASPCCMPRSTPWRPMSATPTAGEGFPEVP